MEKICRFCEAPFKTDDDPYVETVCQDCKKEVKNVVVNDPVFLQQMAKEIFSLPAITIGLGGPGTIAQYFPDDVPSKISQATE